MKALKEDGNARNNRISDSKRDLRSKQHIHDPIAIIGFSAKLPQDAVSAEAFWRLISEGRTTRSTIPQDRFNLDAFYHPNPDRPDTIPVRHGNFISENVAAFDAPFFSIQPTEALSMDPQQRLMLETTYRALENAGLGMEVIAGSKTGVFVGTSSRDYETLLLRDPDQPAKYIGTGIGTSLLANRVSWFFDLKGPSLALDTACSSSLNALHLACQSIQSGESDMGLVGGCNLILAPDVSMVHLSNMGFFSPDGICYTFDSRANGYAKGEGVCVVVVKRLLDAIRDGDCIRAVIRASASNQDGRTPGLTTPSQQAQVDNIIHAYEAAGLSLETTGHFEAHGTGTKVGDVLEATAINAAFQRSKANPLSVGALKPNIGHLEAASGTAGLIKTILMLEHGAIPPNIWFQRTNPAILANEWNLKFPRELSPWPTAGQRRISLNSFGYGGANVHVILDVRGLKGRHNTNPDLHDAEKSEIHPINGIRESNGSLEPRNVPKVLVWSAFDEAGVTRLMNSFQEHFRATKIPTKSAQEDFLHNLSWSLIAELGMSEATFPINRADLSQPLCTAIQLALVDLLSSWSIHPAAVVGHSSGEIAAAYCAGGLSFESSIKAAYFRGLLASKLDDTEGFDGAMTSVALSQTDVLPFIAQAMNVDNGGKISIGCINSPQNVTVTGDSSCIEVLNDLVSAEGIFTRRLAVSVAYHSHHMETLASEYLEKLGTLSPPNPKQSMNVPFFSTVKGDRISRKYLVQPEYWVANMVSPVRFAEAMEQALCCFHTVGSGHGKVGLLEIGPHGALQRPIKDIVDYAGYSKNTFYLSPLSRNISAFQSCLGTVGRLYCQGYPVDLLSINSPLRDRSLLSPVVNLPEYPFNHSQTYWQESRISKNYRFRQHSRHELVGVRSSDWNHHAPKWRSILRASELPWLQDHKFDNIILLPAAGMLIMAIEGLRQLDDFSDAIRGWTVRDVRFLRPLLVSSDSEGTETQLHLSPRHPEGSIAKQYNFSIYVWAQSDWSRACEGIVGVDHNISSNLDEDEAAQMLTAGAKCCQEVIDKEQYYENITTFGYHFGPAFQTVEQLRYSDDGMARASIQLAAKKDMVIYPTELDGILQLGTASISRGSWAHIPLYIPTRLNHLWVSKELLEYDGKMKIEAIGQVTFSGYRDADFSFLASTSTGRPLVTVEGFRETATTDTNASSSQTSPKRLCYHLEWKPDLDYLNRGQIECLISADATETGDFQIFDDKTAANPDGHCVAEANGSASDFPPECTLDGNSHVRYANFHGYRIVAKYLDLVIHKDPDIRLLVMGVGEITDMKPIPRSENPLRDLQTANIATYLSSLEFFRFINRRYSWRAASTSYRHLNLAREVESNGVTLATHDIIVLFLPLDTAQKFLRALRNIRCLLRSGGKAILYLSTIAETKCTDDAKDPLKATNGQWRSTTSSPDSSWNRLLAQSGFASPETDMTSSLDDSHSACRLLIVKAKEFDLNGDALQTESETQCTLVADHHSKLQMKTAEAVTTLCSTFTCHLISMEQLQKMDVRKSRLVFLIELDRSVFRNINSQNFEMLKRSAQSANSIIWVTQGGGALAPRPESGIVTGFGRNRGSEDWSIPFIELALEAESSIDQMAHHVCSVLEKVVDGSRDQPETELIEYNGLLHAGRVIDSPDLNAAIHQRLVPQPAESHKFNLVNQPLKLTIGRPGVLDALQFEDDWSYNLPLEDEQVEIRIIATGVNFKDIMIALGQIPGDSFGFECAGVISRAGKLTGFCPDQQVCCFTTQCAYGTFVRTSVAAVAPIPPGLSFSDAASIPVVFCSAYYGLITLGRLQAGESVLIHSGAGGVGQAAIQIAQRVKAKIFTTVSTEEKKQLLIQQYGIPAEHIFSSRDTAFAPALKRLVGGPDVVLNSLSGEGLRASWLCIAPMGRFIELGLTDINSKDGLATEPFRRNATFSSFDLALVFSQAPSTFHRVLSHVMELFKSPSDPLRPVIPIHSFPVSKIVDAFRYMQGGKNTGKTVIRMDGEATIPVWLSRSFSIGLLMIPEVIPSMKPTYYFDAAATYVIAGGLGGLGRCIAQWMSSRGARHFLMLSRSGLTSSTASDFVEDMEKKGIRIHAPACDITDETRLMTVLTDCKDSMPPIQGCIQSTMILHDNFFMNMPHEDFVSVLQPKVQGSWNLHNHLPAQLSFFVLLSSISSVTGSRAQANYASANAYQNALARHRVARGQKALALSLGPVMGVGKVAEGNLNAMLKREGFQGIRKAELLALLEWACDPTRQLMAEQPWRTQIISGLGYIEQLPQERLQDIYWARKPLFSRLRQLSKPEDAASSKPDASADAASYAKLIEGADSDTKVIEIILKALISRLSRVLSISEDDIESSKPIHAFGIDSLVGVEVKYWFDRELHADLAIFDIMGAESLYTLAQKAAEKSRIKRKAATV
ncbi:MAG: hypothetical protein Q9227_004819 [Pyrenula ochraceoflavens]